MAQRFFVSDLSGGLVKQILCQTNLPVVRTISYGEWMIAGMQYQLASSVVLCTQSGVYPGGTPAVGVDLRCDEDVICDDSLAVDEITKAAQSEGMNTLRQAAAKYVLDGTTAYPEMMKITYDADDQ